VISNFLFLKIFVIKGVIYIMSRRRTPKKRFLSPDPVYDSHLVHMIVNHIMKKGKKSLAYRIFYEAMKQIGETTKKDPVEVIEQAIRNATPVVEVKARRIGGSTYQVPLEVNKERGTALAIRWILSSCKKRSGRNMILKLTNEFLDASNKMGNAIKKRDEIHKMAEANKAFAKYRM
jgi:small subunit ribosomal protein S7